MRTKEVAEICGVTEECIRQNAKKVGMDFGYGEFTNHNWTEEELKRIQVQLMKNSANAGTGSMIVKQQNQTSLELGALTLAANASVDATKQLCELLMSKALETQQLQLAEAKNKELQAIVDKYVNWKSAKEIKLEFKLPARPGIEKVAMLLNLKENEDWIARFYDEIHPYKKILYSPEAVERIVEFIKDLI